MPVRNQPEFCPKAVISVSEMCARCGLSRSHWYALVRSGVMPYPCYDLRTRRPIYPRELQQMCLQVRATNVGANGQYIIFYSRQNAGTVESPRLSGPVRRSRRAIPSAPSHAGMIEGLRALGLAEVDDAQVENALRVCYPSGHAEVEEGHVLRSVWQHLRRTNAAR